MDINFNAYTDKDLVGYVHKARHEIATRHEKADSLVANCTSQNYVDWKKSIGEWLRIDIEIGNLENLMRKCMVELKCRGVRYQ